ncbi:unnamed protein product [Nezara viridula]|uniref:Uncharacterized protein n=1 Tax=Nezara viridula TaxID=85310 RepID=A0A9P0HE98_NEZVI|nr:unnamed protein product [Nezara viridula]
MHGYRAGCSENSSRRSSGPPDLGHRYLYQYLELVHHPNVSKSVVEAKCSPTYSSRRYYYWAKRRKPGSILGPDLDKQEHELILGDATCCLAL